LNRMNPFSIGMQNDYFTQKFNSENNQMSHH
jgi:hypothetical protein